MKAVAPQQRLGDRYVIEEHVASGGMAEVWRARDEVLARTVAIKVLRDHLASKEDFRARFQREAIAAARLNHPNIVSIFDTGVDDGLAYIVMEYFEGRTLADILAERRALDPGEAVAIAVPVLEALAYAHVQGVVHRDVKPANILVGAGDRVKVTDFGIAKVAAGDDLTTTGKVLGTVRYLSPEQVEGRDLDGRSDLYSVGLVLYEAVTGRPPFQAESDMATAMMRLTGQPPPPRAIVPGIPRDVEAAILRAMATRPEERFPSAESMRAALERWVAPGGEVPGTVVTPLPVAAVEAGVGHRVGRGTVFRSWMLVPLVLLGISAAAIAGGFAVGRLELGGPFGIQAAPGGGGDRVRAVKIAGAEDVDPLGDGEENRDEIGFVVDGDPDTAWSTDHYTTEAFGQLKEGLGVWIELARPSRVSRVTVRSAVPGWRFQLLASRDVPPAGRELRSVDGDGTFSMGDQGRVLVELEAERISGFMIWITALGPDDGEYAAEIEEVVVAGPAS